MRRKSLTKEEYINLYCKEKRIRHREIIYISKDIHQKLKDIAFIFKFKHYTTLSSLTDAILSYHLQIHNSLLDDIRQEFREECLRSFSSMEKDQDDNKEDNEDDDESD